MRKLSYHRSGLWMSSIAKFRKYKNQARGENSGRAKFKEIEILKIRANPPTTWEEIKQKAAHHNVTPSYILKLTKKPYKTWRHLK